MPKVYHGDQAVAEAMKYYGQKGAVDPMAEHIIKEEGFVPGIYKDDVGIDTEGIGLTGQFIGKNFFTEVLPVFEQRSRKVVPSYNKQPTEVQKAIMSAVYRGDMGTKTAALLEKGEYKKAAIEYLNHAEYRRRKRKNPDDGVVKRMERNAKAFFDAQ